MNPLTLEAIRQTAEAIRAQLGEDADVDTLLDTLDGETDAADILDALIAADAEARAMQAAAKSQANALTSRAMAFGKRSDAIRGGIGRLLDAIGERKITRPTATVSRTKPRQSVDVTDPDALPQGFYKTARVPQTREIADALKSGEYVPGATLKEGAPGVMVRT